MFKISDFSKLSQVSMRTLRYYDEIGLLKPVHVDTLTGYRYYSADQLPRLNRIIALKDLGFELSHIVQLLDEELPPEQLRGMLRMKQIEIQQRVLAEQERLARVEARLKQLEASEARLPHEVTLKKVKPQLVASSRTSATNFAQKNQFATNMLSLLRKNGVRQIDHLLFIDPDTGYRDTDMTLTEVVVPVQSSSVGNIVERSGGRITIRELPGVNTMATLLYHGSPYTMTEAYQALGSWIEGNDYVISGSCRRVCLHREGELDEYVTEIQFPVEKREVVNSRHLFHVNNKRSTSLENEELHTFSLLKE